MDAVNERPAPGCTSRSLGRHSELELAAGMSEPTGRGEDFWRTLGSMTTSVCGRGVSLSSVSIGECRSRVSVKEVI